MGQQKIYQVEVPAGMSMADGLAQAQAKARGAGISIEGDVEGGVFHGVAEGRYRVEGRQLRLEVEKSRPSSHGTSSRWA